LALLFADTPPPQRRGLFARLRQRRRKLGNSRHA
jgi:hypothetical protein